MLRSQEFHLKVTAPEHHKSSRVLTLSRLSSYHSKDLNLKAVILVCRSC